MQAFCGHTLTRRLKRDDRQTKCNSEKRSKNAPRAWPMTQMFASGNMNAIRISIVVQAGYKKSNSISSRVYGAEMRPEEQFELTVPTG